MMMQGAIPFSTFQVDKKIIPYGSDEVIVILSSGETISFFGRVQLRVCAGAVRVYGHVFRKSSSFSSLYAPYTSFCHTIFVEETSHKLPSDAIGKAIERQRGGASKGQGVVKEGGTAVVVLKSLQGADVPSGWFEMPRSFADWFQSSDPFLIPAFHPVMDVPMDCIVPQFNEPMEYAELARLMPDPATLASSNSLFTILVCGPTHAGKSTFCSYKELLFLEADVGQSEFTAPGLVSLIKEPLIGPPFTHTRAPVKSYYLGDTSPARNPTHYIDAFCSLVEFYRNTYPGVPLIINTCGWIHGMGKDMLVEHLKFAQPDVIVNMRNPVELGRRASRRVDIQFLSNDQHDEFMRHTFPDSLPHVVDVRITVQAWGPNVMMKEKTPGDMRLVQMLSYFGSHSNSVSDHIPYSVPWNKIRIVFTEQVPPSQALHALNGTVVGLCIDTTQYTVHNPDQSSTNAHLYPEFILADTLPLCECIGTGIVRCIDPTTRQFFIIVPPSVSPQRLQQVNTLVRGTIPTPIPLSLSVSLSAAGHRVISSAPYTAVYTPKHKRREDPSRVAECVRLQSKGDQNAETMQKAYEVDDVATTEVYGPDTEIDTSTGALEESMGVDEEDDLSLTPPTTPRAKPAKAIITAEGPKAIEEIGLQEEMELLEHEWLKHSPSSKAASSTHKPSQTKTSRSTSTTKTPPKSTSATNKASKSTSPTKTTPKSTPPAKTTPPKSTSSARDAHKRRSGDAGKDHTIKSQKQKLPPHSADDGDGGGDDGVANGSGVQSEENEEDTEMLPRQEGEEVGRFVRNPNPQDTDIALLEQHERAWEAIEMHEESVMHEAHEHTVMDVMQRKQHFVSPKNVLLRARVRDRRVAKRIAPAGDLEVVGSKRVKRIPRR